MRKQSIIYVQLPVLSIRTIITYQGLIMIQLPRNLSAQWQCVVHWIEKVICAVNVLMALAPQWPVWVQMWSDTGDRSSLTVWWDLVCRHAWAFMDQMYLWYIYYGTCMHVIACTCIKILIMIKLSLWLATSQMCIIKTPPHACFACMP